MAKREPVILHEGACAYVLQEGVAYDIRVHSTNHVTHLSAGTTDSAERAKRVCDGLNRYPRQTRRAYGLL